MKLDGDVNKVFLNLEEKPEWKVINIKAGTKLDKVQPLFTRI